MEIYLLLTSLLVVRLSSATITTCFVFFEHFVIIFSVHLFLLVTPPNITIFNYSVSATVGPNKTKNLSIGFYIE